jgi:hypothetical protein
MAVSTDTAQAVRLFPFRWTFVAIEGLVALGGIAGAWQLWTGTFVPPVSDLEPLGLDSWRLPAVWLFATVAVPSTFAAVTALQRRPQAPLVVVGASALLLVEVVVQIPFIGPSALQAVFGSVAVVMGSLGVAAHRSGRWRKGA